MNVLVYDCVYSFVKNKHVTPLLMLLNRGFTMHYLTAGVHFSYQFSSATILFPALQQLRVPVMAALQDTKVEGVAMFSNRPTPYRYAIGLR